MSATLQTAKEQCDCSTDQSIYSKTKNGWYTEIILSGTTYTNTYRMDHLGYLIGEWVKVGIHGVSPVALTQEPTAVLAYIVCTPSDGLNPSAH